MKTKRKLLYLLSGTLFLDAVTGVGKQYKYFIDTVHYSRIGIDRLAAAYGRILIDNELIKPIGN